METGPKQNKKQEKKQEIKQEIKQAKKGKEIRECKQEVGKRNFFCPTSNKTQTLAQSQLYMSPLLTTSPSYLILKI